MRVFNLGRHRDGRSLSVLYHLRLPSRFRCYCSKFRDLRGKFGKGRGSFYASVGRTGLVAEFVREEIEIDVGEVLSDPQADLESFQKSFLGKGNLDILHGLGRHEGFDNPLTFNANLLFRLLLLRQGQGSLQLHRYFITLP